MADAVALRRCCQEQNSKLDSLQVQVEIARGSKQEAEAAAATSLQRAQACRAELDETTFSLHKVSCRARLSNSLQATLHRQEFALLFGCFFQSRALQKAQSALQACCAADEAQAQAARLQAEARGMQDALAAASTHHHQQLSRQGASPHQTSTQVHQHGASNIK